MCCFLQKSCGSQSDTPVACFQLTVHCLGYGSCSDWYHKGMGNSYASCDDCISQGSPERAEKLSREIEPIGNKHIYVCVDSAQVCPTLCDPMDSSGSSVHGIHGIFQARTLEWVAISYSKGSSWPRYQTASLASTAFTGGFFTTVPPGLLYMCVCVCVCI